MLLCCAYVSLCPVLGWARLGLDVVVLEPFNFVPETGGGGATLLWKKILSGGVIDNEVNKQVEVCLILPN
jgi:hypothetical protein